MDGNYITTGRIIGLPLSPKTKGPVKDFEIGTKVHVTRYDGDPDTIKALQQAGQRGEIYELTPYGSTLDPARRYVAAAQHLEGKLRKV